jgi:hypothetical protein
VPFYHQYRIHALIISACIFFLPSLTSAQINKTYALSFKDTLYADNNTFLLYNNLILKNSNRDSIFLNVSISPPEGFKMISGKMNRVSIAGNSELTLPITISKKNNASALWQKLKIVVNDDKSSRWDSVYINIYTAPVSRFSVTPVSVGFLSDRARSFGTRFILKNYGNVKGEYHVSLIDEKISLDYKSAVVLEAGKDTVINIVRTIPKNLWSAFKNENILFKVADSLFVKNTTSSVERFIKSNTNNSNNNNPYISTLELFRQDSSFEMHNSKFSTFKLDIESGALGSSNSLSYYAGVRMEMPTGNNSKLLASYKSRQFGIYNIIDRGVYDLRFQTKKWLLHFGKIANAKYFLTYGNGVSIEYKWGLNKQVSLFGVRHTPGFYTTNDNAGVNLRYQISKILVSHDFVLNQDSASKLHSYVFNNDIQLSLKKLDVSINGGYGSESNTLVSRKYHNLSGGFVGYRINLKLKSWSFASQTKFYGNYFPGLNASSRSQNHSISYRLKKVSAEAYYYYSVRSNNYFRDSIYNTDALSFNIRKYGTRFSISPKNNFVTFGGGILIQEGQKSYSFAPKYDFFELQFNHRSNKNFNFNISSTNGYSQFNHKYITSNNLAVNFHYFGINGGFSSVPLFDSSQQNRNAPSYNNTLYGGPYVSLTVFKLLNIGAQYNVSKTLYDNRVNSIFGLNISYKNPRNGTDFLVNASAPLKQAEAANLNPFKYGYVNISLRKTMNLPLIFKRKYHTISATIYEDKNGNNRYDKTERKLPGLPFSINDVHFITNEDGLAEYKNVEPGEYTIDFTNSEVKGLMPKDGKVQKISVGKKDFQLGLIFKESRTISGQISILQDSSEKFKVNLIKVIAVDSTGTTYLTTADHEGKYFLNLPAGIYTVSLNPEVFNSYFIPVQMSFTTDLYNNQSDIINFTIKQKRREVKMLKVNEEIPVIVTKPKNKTPQKKEVKKVSKGSKSIKKS